MSAGKAVSSLIEAACPAVAEANAETDSEGSWEDAGHPVEEPKAKGSGFFDTDDIPVRQDQRGIEIDCSSIQNSPRSTSSAQDMSIDEFQD